VEHCRERRLPVRSGSTDDDRLTFNLDCGRMQLEIAAGEKAENRGNAPQALLAPD
jgi:hypothetical protein